MAKRKNTKKTPTRKRPTDRRRRTGPMGPQGPPGAPGATGAPGHNHASEITILKAQVEQLVKELQRN